MNPFGYSLLVVLGITIFGCGRQAEPAPASHIDAGTADANVAEAAADTGAEDVRIDVAPPDECKLGRYEGTATGTIVAPVLGTLSGKATIAFALKNDVGDPLGKPQISAGTLSGQACSTPQNCVTYTGDLSGTLDCASRKLQNGIISNGQVVSALGTLPFTGTIDGDYDATLHEFVNGVWTGTSSIGATGNGVWDASYVGP